MEGERRLGRRSDDGREEVRRLGRGKERRREEE